VITKIALHAVLFDLDGVLVHSGPVVERSWTKWARRHDLGADEVLSVCHGRTSVETVRLLTPHLDAAAEARALEAEQARDTAGLSAGDGAMDLIRALDATLTGPAHAVRWAVVTSGSGPLARARLAAVGIPEPAVLITSDDVTQGKPDPEGYLLAARALDVDPRHCVVVEDSEPGARAGLRAGAAVIGVRGGTLAGSGLPLAAHVDTLTSIRLERGARSGEAYLTAEASLAEPAL
jgi:sugar-phosphatase